MNLKLLFATAVLATGLAFAQGAAPSAALSAGPPSEDETNAYRAAMGSRGTPEEVANAADGFAAKYPRSRNRANLHVRAMYEFATNHDHRMIEFGRKAVAAAPTDPKVLATVAFTWADELLQGDKEYGARLAEAVRFAHAAVSNIDTGFVAAPRVSSTVEDQKVHILARANLTFALDDMHRNDFAAAEQLLLKYVDSASSDRKTAMYLRLSDAQEHLKKYREAFASAEKASLASENSGQDAIQMVLRRARLASIVAGGTVIAPACPTAPQSAPSQQSRMIKDPREYSDYIYALNQSDTNVKLQGMQAFLILYPCSVMAEEAALQVMELYQQAGNMDKTVEYADRILQINRSNVSALVMLTYYHRSVASAGKDDAQENAGRSQRYAERGLAALPSDPKPDGMTSAEFTSRQTGVRAIFEGAVGFAALQHKDYGSAQTHLRSAVSLEAQPDIADLYSLAIADLQAKPVNPEGFWFVVKAARLAKGAAQPEILDQGRKSYVRYHGSDQGWSDLVSRASNSQTILPPEGMTVSAAPDAP